MYTFVKVLLMIVLPLGILSEAYASESDLYDFQWLDPDKKVYVLQNKIYKKAHTFTFDIGYLSNLSSDYQDTYGIQFRTGYYFTEEWALELIYNQYSNSNNDTYDNLGRVNGVVPFIRKIDKNYGAAAVWTPFYGKVNTFNRIIYFDWSVGAGLTKIDAQSNADSATNPHRNDYKKESYTGVLGKTNLKFHINKNWHIDLELQNTWYKAEGPVKSQGASWRTNTDVIFGIGLSF